MKIDDVLLSIRMQPLEAEGPPLLGNRFEMMAPEARGSARWLHSPVSFKPERT